ncbi:MAG: pantetheine-phosphate adenylyltransferase [Bacteroidales bacterium]|nr:pantetheine-phosphate adenylyltransferase [Candidatus Physcousia equi]
MTRVLFPGSFNPFTKGHADIVARAMRLFDEVIVAVGYNENKSKRLADIESRMETIRHLYADKTQVRVVCYSGLTTEIAAELHANAILRSVRSVKDYEYELQMADINHRLTGIETIILFARPEYASISSSVVRELQHFGHDITEFLPD